MIRRKSQKPSCAVNLQNDPCGEMFSQGSFNPPENSSTFLFAEMDRAMGGGFEREFGRNEMGMSRSFGETLERGIGECSKSNPFPACFLSLNCSQQSWGWYRKKTRFCFRFAVGIWSKLNIQGVQKDTPVMELGEGFQMEWVTFNSPNALNLLYLTS